MAAGLPLSYSHGWLVVYHGVSGTTDLTARENTCYSAGVMVLSEKQPSIIRYRSPEPVLTPELPQERVGTIADVVFSTGIDRRDDLGLPDRFDVYYGMADDRIGVARLDVPEYLPAGALADRPEQRSNDFTSENTDTVFRAKRDNMYYLDRFKVQPGTEVKLKDIDPSFKGHHDGRKEATEEIEHYQKRLPMQHGACAVVHHPCRPQVVPKPRRVPARRGASRKNEHGFPLASGGYRPHSQGVPHG